MPTVTTETSQLEYLNFLQRTVATRIMFGGKFGFGLISVLLLNPTVKEF